MKLLKTLSYLLGLSFAALATAVGAYGGDSALSQAPSFYRGTLGRFQVTALSDGVAPRDFGDILSKKRKSNPSSRATMSRNRFLSRSMHTWSTRAATWCSSIRAAAN